MRESTTQRRDALKTRAEKAETGTVTFLNETVSFGTGAEVTGSAQAAASQSLLWKLKCWGFEHLKWVWLGYDSPTAVPESALEVHRSWLAEWNSGHPIGATAGYLRREWMPHAVSLRLCHWIRYHAWLEDRLSDPFEHEIEQFVAKNAAFLASNVEYGVGGNHLVENGIALLLAGVYAGIPTWRRQGTTILERCGERQFFADGGHYERSPMYHLLVSQRYLSAADILRRHGEPNEVIRRTAWSGAQFAARIRPPDGRIPLVNDSVFGEALPIEEFLTYADRTGIDTDPAQCQSDASGFYWLGSGETKLLVVASELAVPSVPGHAHAHPGQICGWVGGTRVLTDTGVYEYASGHRRDQARSVRSHNTVQVAGSEPAQFGSSFHFCGRIDPEIDYTTTETGSTLTMTYTVKGIGRHRYRHSRSVTATDDEWRIEDEIGATERPWQSRLHLHPAYQATVDSTEVTVRDDEGTDCLRVVAVGAEEVTVETAPYFPEYGRERSRDVITFSRTHGGTMGYTLVPEMAKQKPQSDK
ncbi:alginate lyase family protein [Halomicrobium katesii]|uniref:alginate lyase family protein n=1 Tax=Halomicrobium katesii TaxID=437163 RepID=UPI0014613AA6|nr:alginate lyase family protein [Halomicrobium katesii]